jgi:hypothetical protein
VSRAIATGRPVGSSEARVSAHASVCDMESTYRRPSCECCRSRFGGTHTRRARSSCGLRVMHKCLTSTRSLPERTDVDASLPELAELLDAVDLGAWSCMRTQHVLSPKQIDLTNGRDDRRLQRLFRHRSEAHIEIFVPCGGTASPRWSWAPCSG